MDNLCLLQVLPTSILRVDWCFGETSLGLSLRLMIKLQI